MRVITDLDIVKFLVCGLVIFGLIKYTRWHIHQNHNAWVEQCREIAAFEQTTHDSLIVYEVEHIIEPDYIHCP